MRLVEEPRPYEDSFADRGGSGSLPKKNEFPIDTLAGRKKFAKSMRGKLQTALGIVHPVVDFSGKTTEPQEVRVNDFMHRTIIVEPHALTVTTLRTDKNNLSHTIETILGDSGDFSFEDMLLGSDRVEATDVPIAKNDEIAKNRIVGVLKNFEQEAAQEK